jgi:hypothetical protein
VLRDGHTGAVLLEKFHKKGIIHGGFTLYYCIIVIQYQAGISQHANILLWEGKFKDRLYRILCSRHGGLGWIMLIFIIANPMGKGNLEFLLD